MVQLAPRVSVRDTLKVRSAAEGMKGGVTSAKNTEKSVRKADNS